MWASGHSAATVKRAAHGYEPTRDPVHLSCVNPTHRRARWRATVSAAASPETANTTSFNTAPVESRVASILD
jgi:hypothetical protein